MTTESDRKKVDQSEKERILTIFNAGYKGLALDLLTKIFEEKFPDVKKITYGTTDELLVGEDWEDGQIGLIETRSTDNKKLLKASFWRRDEEGRRENLVWTSLDVWNNIDKSKNSWRVYYTTWEEVVIRGESVTFPVTFQDMGGVSDKIEDFLQDL